MGLNFSHCDACWSYTSFGVFRHELAKCVGIDLDKMCGFNGNTSWASVKEPLVPFLNHSDCDGDLSVEELKLVMPRLEALLQDPTSDISETHRSRGLELVSGMKFAIDLDESLRFC